MREIIAMGGGGFSMEPDNPRLDDFILSRARRSRPRVCFVPTASGDAPGYVVRFYRAFATKDCIPADLMIQGGGSSLPRQPLNTSNLAGFIGAQDVIYVGGGNTANMLALWRTHGVDRLLRDAWNAGTILCGLSAGMICWFRESITDSFGALAPLRDGLGLLPFSACPHYDGDAQRRPTYQACIANGMATGYAADDGVALVFGDEALRDVVSSRPNARGYRVELRDGAVIETPLETRYLG
jgi:dipeptidase E